MAKTLKMTFELDDGKDMTISLSEPKDGLTRAEVKTACEMAVAKDIFKINGAKPDKFTDAVIREVTETPLV